MLKIINYLRSGLVVSAITAMSVGLSAGSAYAQEDEDEKEKEASSREVLVDCDKGQSVTQTLVQFANDTKLLEITIKGPCDNEPEGIVQIERNKVELIGDEETGGTIPFLLVDGGRQIVIEGNLTLNGGLTVGNGQLEIETEGEVTINGAVIVTGQAGLGIIIEAPDDDDDDESLNGTEAGKVVINGPVSVESQSGLGAVSFVNGGYITFNDDINLNMQSSLNLRDATVKNIDLSYDSHAFLGDNVAGILITCDRESRVWGNTEDIVDVSFDPDSYPCQGDY
jgi:hypothetical protein